MTATERTCGAAQRGSTVRSEARYKPRSAAWVVLRGRRPLGCSRCVPDADSEERLMEERGGYLWFNGVRVFAEDMRLLCVVGGPRLPAPGRHPAPGLPAGRR